jgi:predicted RNA-binding Zn-ribbon protein involved in translation (DUF1610 family)
MLCKFCGKDVEPVEYSVRIKKYAKFVTFRCPNCGRVNYRSL